MRKVEFPEITFILNNLLPVLGVIFLGWSAFEILILYWAETVIASVFSFVKVFRAEIYRGKSVFAISKDPDKVGMFWKILLLALFVVCFFSPGFISVLLFPFTAAIIIFRNKLKEHVTWLKNFSFKKTENEAETVIFIMAVVYGAFLFVHYIALIIFGAFARELHPSDLREGFFSPVWENPSILVSIITCAVSYFISYRMDFILKEEYKNEFARDQLTSPVKRIMIVQASVLLGGAVAIILSQLFKTDEFILKGVMVGMLVLIKNIADMSTYKKTKPISVNTNS